MIIIIIFLLSLTKYPILTIPTTNPQTKKHAFGKFGVEAVQSGGLIEPCTDVTFLNISS